jgi:hypothetical protein
MQIKTALKFYLIPVRLAIFKKTNKLGISGYACNPSYSGGRDLEDHGLRLARTNSLTDPISKIKIHTKKVLKW